MIITKLHFFMSLITASLLSVFMYAYFCTRWDVAVSCKDPKIGNYAGKLHPSRVIETSLGWVVTRPVGGVEKTEVYQICVVSGW